MSLALSVLDLVPVRTDQTTADALRASVSLARVADRLGFRRYWVAEHHNMPAVAATNPPVLIAMLAAATERIRLGSGGVMLPNHEPLVVADWPGARIESAGRAAGLDLRGWLIALAALLLALDALGSAWLARGIGRKVAA